MLGYTAQVMSMAQGLDRSSVPSIADLYAKINSGKSRGPTITLESASDAIDLELTDKYSKGWFKNAYDTSDPQGHFTDEKIWSFPPGIRYVSAPTEMAVGENA